MAYEDVVQETYSPILPNAREHEQTRALAVPCVHCFGGMVSLLPRRCRIEETVQELLSLQATSTLTSMRACSILCRGRKQTLLGGETCHWHTDIVEHFGCGDLCLVSDSYSPGEPQDHGALAVKSGQWQLLVLSHGVLRRRFLTMICT